jgi:hypothetical protein
MKYGEKLSHLNCKTIAYYYGYSGIEIKKIQYGIDDYVIYVDGILCENKNVHKSKIRYNNRGAYFMHGNNRIYMDECMRTDI